MGPQILKCEDSWSEKIDKHLHSLEKIVYFPSKLLLEVAIRPTT